MARTRRFGIALLSTPLLALAQSPIGFAPAALIALVPWLWATRIAKPGEAAALGALVGTAYGCAVSLWIPEALGSLGSSPQTAILGLIFTAAWAKLPLFAGVGWLAQRLNGRRPVIQIAGVALAFGLGEWTLGVWRLGIPWALVGHSQLTALGAAQLAVVGGVPLVSAWIVAINMAIALAIGRNRPAHRLAVAFICSWLGMAGLGLEVAALVRPLPQESAGAELLLIQPEIPRYARWNPDAQPWILETMANYTSAALAAGKQNPISAIVWPENLLTTPIKTDDQLSEALQRAVDQWNVPLITGLVRVPSGIKSREYRSSVVWVAPERGVVAATDKFRAVPVLESSRAGFYAISLAPLYGGAASWPKVEEAASPGKSLSANFSITPALCYEVLFPWIVAQRRSPESLAILNLADDSWVEESTATQQLTGFAAFRAIEERLTLVRVAHGGLSTVVDPFGRTLLALPKGAFAHATVQLTPSPPPTFWERLALAALPIVTGVSVWYALLGWARRNFAG